LVGWELGVLVDASLINLLLSKVFCSTQVGSMENGILYVDPMKVRALYDRVSKIRILEIGALVHADSSPI